MAGLGPLPRKDGRRNRWTTASTPPKRLERLQENMALIGDTNDSREQDFVTLAPTDTMAALLHLCQQFPRHKFRNRLPGMALKHQLYAILNDRTAVDRELLAAQRQGKVRVLRLWTAAEDYIVMPSEAYYEHIRLVTASELDDHSGEPSSLHEDGEGDGTSTASRNQDAQEIAAQYEVVGRFLAGLGREHWAASIQFETLAANGFSEDDVRKLVHAGILQLGAVGSYWLSAPGLGLFVKHLLKGRQGIQTALRRTRYRQMLESGLLQRKLPGCWLDMRFLVRDALGSGVAECTATDSGRLICLRLDVSEERKRRKRGERT